MTGILDMPADQYHADQVADRPSLSSSIANLLCTATPLHAWTHHPKLNPDFVRTEEQKFDVGTAAHAVLLEGVNSVQVVDAADWRTKASQEARDQARAEGKVPLLAKQVKDLDAMVVAALDQLSNHGAQPELFAEGKAEQSLVWEEDGGVVCRARLDWLRDDHATIDDLKTTSRSANPEAYSRNLFGVGGDVQAAFYIRGVERLTGQMPDFRWVVVETSPPYALSVIAPGPDILTIGRKKVEFALDVWRRCLATDTWPGYPTDVCYAELPSFEEARWLERELREAA